MPKKLQPFYQLELQNYNDALAAKDLLTAWKHLERAHILGQRYPFSHHLVHWKMLQFGIAIKSPKEVLGQIPRLLVGGIKSFVGKVPTGNPGGANVPPMKSFPISQELQLIFLNAGIEVE